MKSETSRLLCNVCGKIKSRKHYYPSVTARCKECHNEAVKKTRAKNIEHYKKYDRERARDPKRLAAHRAYQRSMKDDPGFKARHIKSQRAWVEKNKLKAAAHIIMHQAIRAGKITKPKICEACGIATSKSRRMEGHHEDYTEPLKIMWLCRICHKMKHRFE
jgi:hypothetical protein